MSLTLADLKAGPKLPTKEVYIDALGDSIIIQPVPLKRYKSYTETVKDLIEKAQAIGDDDPDARLAAFEAAQDAENNLKMVMVAESISEQTGGEMSIEDARTLVDEVRDGMHPGAFDEIRNAVLETAFGTERFQSMGNG